MVPRKLRLWLAVIIFLLAVGFIIISLLPTPRIQQVLPVPPVILPTPAGGALWMPEGAPHLALAWHCICAGAA